jgi:putative flippase GtrA
VTTPAVSHGWKTIAARWLKFNAVGGIGIGVQLAVLAALRDGLRLDYLLATGIAVEAAVVHNYLWHERFTWADRVAGNGLARFTRFNLTTGALSIVCNLVLMRILVGEAGAPYLVANGIAIATCSIANFLVSDRFVFRVKTQPVVSDHGPLAVQPRSGEM